MMIRQGMGMAIGGLLAGIVASFGLTRFMVSVLYDVEPTDPATFAVTAIALSAAAFVASWLPALRAASVDPNVALRYE